MNLLVQLNHPAVLRVFGLCSWEDRIGIVMERASSSLPTPNSFSLLTVEYAKQLCQGVRYLHSKAVVHGDLKPGNVLVVDGRIRIADFGTSRNIESTSTIPRTEAMTIRYAAPEQFENTVTPHSDIYSLGVVLYELFENKEAFKGMKNIAVMGAKYGGKSLLFDGSIPAELCNIIQSCLNPNPLLRPSVSQIIDILENLQIHKQKPQQLDCCLSSLELESLKEKNQTQSGQILLLQTKNEELVTNFQHERQSLIQTNRQLQNEVNLLMNQIALHNPSENLNGLSNRFPKLSVLSSSHSSNGSNSEQSRPLNQNARNADEDEWSKLKPKVKKLLEEMKDGNVASVVLCCGVFEVPIGVEDTKALAHALKSNDTVSSVNLSRNSIGAEGARALADALKNNDTVSSVNLSRNSIGAEGARALADALIVNTTVKSINLEYNSITDEGARALAEALKINSTLTNLNLEDNSIRAEGARALAEALKINSTLTNLNLEYNSIGAEGALALSTALKINVSVTNLNLDDNSIGAEGALALTEALKVNNNLNIDGGCYLQRYM
ncbi:hypothetical protein GEMRC1_008114 [Eukaryota sp. GEM-RC1]